MHLPGGNIGDSVVVFKGQLDFGHRCTTTQELSRVGCPDGFLVIGVLILCTQSSVQSRRIAVKRQTQAVNDGRFSGTGVTGNQEQVLTLQRGGAKVNLSLLD